VSQLACQHMPDEVIDALVAQSETSLAGSYPLDHMPHILGKIK